MFLFGAGEEFFGRTLAKAVEDNLHGLDIGIFDRFHGLIDFFYAHAVEAEFAGLDKVIEDSEDFGVVIESGWRAVELEQVEAIGGEIF